jgi:protocatechuate 3,4-dioxygenase beta subunit
MKIRTRTLVVLLLAAAAAVLAQDGRLGVAAQSPGVGERLLLQGRVLDTGGNPLPGAVVELWQADANGNYNHPADARPSELLDDFQYFGTSTAGPDGAYAFLTVKPPPYDARPPHLHLKVKLRGETALTSQFYFEEDRAAVEADFVYRNAGDSLFLRVTEGADAEGKPVGIATGDIVLDRNEGAPDALAPTPRQAEGPYYPRVDFSGYDNDLTRASTDDEPVRPRR